jgi:hypothetical protein
MCQDEIERFESSKGSIPPVAGRRWRYRYCDVD